MNNKEKWLFSFFPPQFLIAPKLLLVDKIGEFIYFFCRYLTAILFLLRISFYGEM